MNRDYNYIKQNYPKSFEKFESYMLDKPLKFEEEYCYCDIEEFFDNNNIYIEIVLNNAQTWNICISDKYKYYNEENKYFNADDTDKKTRQEAKEQAVLKSFEIMEGLIK